MLSERWLPGDADCAACVQARAHEPVGSPGVVRIEVDGAPATAPCHHLRGDGCRLIAAQQRWADYCATREQAEEHERERAWLRWAGVGARYWDARRELLREPEPICAYLDALEENVHAGRGLILLGGLGVGKSAALGLIAREAYRRGRIPTWATTVTRLIRHLLRDTEIAVNRDPWGQEHSEDPKLRPLLLLDEFGAAYESEYAVAAFEDYMGWRYDNRLATCVAGNLTPDDIRASEHYTRMVDRWRETCRVVVIGGESMRGA